MDFDLSKLSIDELNNLIEKAAVIRNNLVADRRVQLLAELAKLDEMPLAHAPAPKGKTGNPGMQRSLKMYRDNKGNVWRGMGRMPNWMREHIAAGAKLEDFLVE